MRRRVDAAMNHMADLVKDLLLDGLPADDDVGMALGPLPPLSSEEFIEKMRPRVEQTLRQAAEAINAAPGDPTQAACEEATCDLFTELWLLALRTGVQMRLAAAVAEEQEEDEVPPQGEWARRYRRMHAGDPLDERIR
jgi:hypothetical protein